MNFDFFLKEAYWFPSPQATIQFHLGGSFLVDTLSTCNIYLLQIDVLYIVDRILRNS